MGEIPDLRVVDRAQSNDVSCFPGKQKNFWHQCSVSQALQTLREGLTDFANTLPKLAEQNGTSSSLLFLDSESKIVLMNEADFDTPENWFYIGDIHADFFALHTLLQHIYQSCPDFRLVFLGDLVDRGAYSVECIVLLLVWAVDHPGRVIWIAGNHDIAFSRDSAVGTFSSSVEPSEFVDTLNADSPQHELIAQLGEFFMQLAQKLPRAVLFPDGLLATHGGFPLADLHSSVNGCSTREDFMAWMNSVECIQDITWTRITRYRRRTPNRLSKGCSYGFLDFEAFCQLQPDWFPVKRMVTGHEHVQEGFHSFPEYLNNPTLTLTGMGFDELKTGDSRYDNYRAFLTTGRHQRNGLPSKVEVPVDINLLRTLHPTGAVRDDQSCFITGDGNYGRA